MAERYTKLAEWSIMWKKGFKMHFPSIFIYYLRYHELLSADSEYYCAIDGFRLLPYKEPLSADKLFPVKSRTARNREVRDVNPKFLKNYKMKRCVSKNAPVMWLLS